MYVFMLYSSQYYIGINLCAPTPSSQLLMYNRAADLFNELLFHVRMLLNIHLFIHARLSLKRDLCMVIYLVLGVTYTHNANSLSCSLDQLWWTIYWLNSTNVKAILKIYKRLMAEFNKFIS